MSNSISATTLEVETATSSSAVTAVKRQKLLPDNCQLETEESRHQHQSLLPGIPDHIAQICLSLVPARTLYSVCRSWRRLLYSPSFPPFLSLYALFSPTETQGDHLSNSVELCSFDPISRHWLQIPLPPAEDPPLRFLFRHPSFISRKLPIQSVSVSGNLAIVAATNDQFLPALSCPLVFKTSSEKWVLGPPIPAPRRWCAAGATGGAVYVASGIGSHYNTDVARTVEKWDLNAPPPQHRRWRWEKMGRLKDGKFSREAIEAVGWRGKLCMVNVKGDAAKEGIVYDVGSDSWEQMPEGMLAGWRGPAAALDERTIYAVDETKGSLKRYDHMKDAWVEVVENKALKGAQQVAAAGGKVCVLCADGGSITVVDVAAPPPARLWVVDVPVRSQVVAIHILPRLSRLDFQSN